MKGPSCIRTGSPYQECVDVCKEGSDSEVPNASNQYSQLTHLNVWKTEGWRLF